MKFFLLFLIKIYQLCLSPFVGSCCRFVPSCSEYAREAIEKNGPFKGGWQMLKRLAKCGPWHPGGVDFVMEESSDTSQLE